MKNIEFVPKAFEDYRFRIEHDRKTASKTGDLIRDILRTLFEGLGKPKPLKYDFKK